MKKKVFTLLLALALLAGLLTVPAGAADTVSTFSDITDPAVGEAVEVLRTMGVLGGVGGGLYDPEGSLTRAQFSKIAVLVMGRGGDVAAYETRTIFVDVPSTHWARGYINLAVNTEVDGARLLQGVGNGCFNPDKPITYDEAVTVLLRMLGYGTQISVNWPLSARTVRASVKLDEGLGAIDGGSPIDRGQAAVLFKNLLTATTSGGSAYAAELGTVREGVILTSVTARTADGGEGVTFSDSAAAVKAAASLPAAFMVGKRGTALFDGKGRFLTFIPESSGASRSVTVQSVSATGITGTDGVTLPVASSAKVLRDGQEYVYGEIYQGLNRPGLVLTVYYTAAGNIDYIFVRGVGAVSGETMIAEKDGAGAFDAITNGSRTCRVLKNGAAVTQAALRRLDVGAYDASTDTLYVTDFRLLALFEAASPNPYAPISVTLCGRTFDVLPSAVPGFEDVSVGSLAVFLFTPDGKIAGVKREGAASSNAVGIVREAHDAGTVTVELLNSPLAPDENGAVTLTAAASGSVAPYLGRLVTVSGSYRRENGRNVSALSLSLLPSEGSGNLDVAARTVGSVALAENAAVYEKVGMSAMTLISLADIPFDTVPASKVAFVHYDLTGKVDILVLDDVTGDRYTYGFWTESSAQTDTIDGIPVMNTVTVVTYGEGQTLEVVGDSGYDTKLGGAVRSLETIGISGHHRSAGFAPLTAVENATQASFDLSSGTFTSGSFTIPIAGAVRCYNESSGTWFDSLAKAMLYSNSFTAYYDRTPTTGAKVRVVIVH